MPRTMHKLISMLTGPVALISWLLTSVAATYVGPFGTYSYLGFTQRAGYWFTIIAVSIVLALGTRVLVEERVPALNGLSQSAAVIGLFSAAYAGTLYAINSYVFSDVWDQVPSLPELWLFIVLISCGIEALRYFVKTDDVAEQEPAQPEKPVQPAFLNRLKPGIGTGLVRLKVRDHYVEAHTDSGSDLLLMRFSDAIRELDGIEGMQVHRSHWVAVDAVTGHRKEKGKLFLVMADGTEVPVSRNYRGAVVEAGLI